MMKLQCNSEWRGVEQGGVYQHACSARSFFSHAHTFCSADHVALMEFQNDGVSGGMAATQSDNKKKIGAGLSYHAGAGITHRE